MSETPPRTLPSSEETGTGIESTELPASEILEDTQRNSEEGIVITEDILERQRQEDLAKTKENLETYAEAAKEQTHENQEGQEESKTVVKSSTVTTHTGGREGVGNYLLSGTKGVFKALANYKNWFALLGLFGAWILQAIKAAPTMAGKGGGGGHAKKNDHGGGGGGHH